MQFIDEAKIHIKAGNGGPGCVSFRREANVPMGGPDGGNGGRGGSVIIQAIPGLNTLIDFRYKQHFKATSGENGKGRNRHGAAGSDCIIHVPIGTQIWDEDGNTLLADITTENDSIVIAKGGDGGYGNTHYKSSVNQSPRRSTPGFPGESISLWLKLKLLSDVGLVGLPNAGKSTFLSCVSRAKPKIADYPFTTLKPQLGVASIDEKEFVIADIPGLIEGAHQGTGLGDRFLKHIERCNIILHLIDITQESPLDAYHTIRHELEQYSNILINKTEIIALTKSDALDSDSCDTIKQSLQENLDTPIYAISSIKKEGTSDVLRAILHILNADDEDTQHNSSTEPYSPV